MGLSHSPRIITDGLVFCVDAANNRSYPGTGTTWTDLVGGNNGTLTNGPTFSSDNRGSIVFDGSDDYVLLDNDITTGSASSITVWVRGLSNDGIIAGATHSSDGGFLLGIQVAGKSSVFLSMYPDNDSTSDSAQFSYDNIVAEAAEWIHLSISRDGLIAYFYINGGEAILMTTYNNSGTMATRGTRTSSIGAMDTGSSPMTGRLACLQLYNRALTADEVRQNYNATRGRFQ